MSCLGARGVILATSVVALAGCASMVTPTASADASTTRATACAFHADGGPWRAALAVQDGPQLILIGADGTRRMVHEFTHGTDVAPLMAGTHISRGGFILASMDRGTELTSIVEESVLLDRSGRVLWHRESAPGGVWTLNERGTAVFQSVCIARPCPDHSEGIEIDPDGTAHPFDHWSALGEADVDGAVPVYGDTVIVNGTYVVHYGWLRPETGAFEAFPYTTTAPMSVDPAWHTGRLLYVGTRNGSPVLVSSRPGDARIIDLPSTARLSWAAVHSGGETDVLDTAWLRIDDEQPDRYWRVDVRTGATTAFGTAPPDGMRPFGAPRGASIGIVFDGAGAGLALMRDEYTAGLFRMEPDATSWTRVGGSVRGVRNLAVQARGGTYVLDGVASCFCDTPQWPALPAGQSVDVDGPATQIIRPSDRAVHIVHATGIELDAQGRCAAWFDRRGDGSALVVLDVTSGSRVDAYPPSSTVSQLIWVD